MNFNDNIIEIRKMNKKEQFEKLFTQSKAKLYAVAFRVVHNKEQAEDVLQDAYIKAWRKFDEFDPNKKFSNWMTTIVRNAGIDSNRTKARQLNAISLESMATQSDDEKKITYDVSDRRIDLYADLERKELYNEINDMIDSLPEDLKVVIRPFFEGQSYGDIADSTDISLSTVRSRVHRAKKILRKAAETSQFANF